MPPVEVLLDPILPVFAILAIGFVMGRRGLVAVAEARTVNRIVMTVFVPVLVFGLVERAPISEFAGRPVLLYFLSEAIFLAAGYLLARRVFGLEPGESVLLGFSGIFANNVFYVLPIALILYGEGGTLPITAVVTLDASVTFAGTIVVLQLIALKRTRLIDIARSLCASPILAAIVLGLVLNAFGVTLSDPIVTFLEFNGAAAAPLALFALGVVLSRTPFTFCGPVVVFTLVKVVLFPAAVWAVLGIFAADLETDQFVLAAAGPAGAMAFSLALLYGVRTDRIAQVIIWSSVLTLVSLAVLA